MRYHSAPVTRVPPSRVPSRPASSQQAQRPRRTRPEIKAQREPRPLKGGASEDSTFGEAASVDPQKAVAEETGAHSAEELSQALAHAEQDGAKESREAHGEAREQAEREDKPSGFFSRMFTPKPSSPKPGQQKPPAQPHSSAPQAPPGKKPGDGFEKSDPRATALAQSKSTGSTTAASFARLTPVAQVKAANQLSGTFARLERPPDAFALLKEAKEKGVLFQEDWERDGHSEDRDDPELAAAVEEVISRVFGKTGILRVGPGRNEQQDPVVVVVATHGFSEQSLAAIPERAGRFATLVALSFELLPLRRER